MVVPAKAGTHNHRRLRYTKDDDPEFLQQRATRRMGPGLRRDDIEFCGGVLPMTPHLRSGVIAGIATLVLDQATKLWLLFGFDIARRGAVKVTPFFDLVLA